MGKIVQACKQTVKDGWQLISWLKHYRKSSKTEPGSNRGKKIVAVGNGPSAAEFPYEQYIAQGYDLCCVNYFALDEEKFFRLKPKFYCGVDPAIANTALEATNKLHKILQRVDWDMHFICYADNHLEVDNPKIHYRYVNHNTFVSPTSSTKNYLYRKNMASCGFQNVLVAVEYYFIMTQAEHVILTGVENDWHRELVVDEDCEVYRECVHFYGTKRVEVTRAGVIAKGELYRYMEWYALTLRQHAIMADFARSNGVRVENACLPSFIDAFPKIRV